MQSQLFIWKRIRIGYSQSEVEWWAWPGGDLWPPRHGPHVRRERSRVCGAPAGGRPPCELPVTVERKQIVFSLFLFFVFFLFFFFFFFREKTHCSNKVLCRSKVAPKKKKRIVFSLVLWTSTQKSIQCSTNKTVFTHSMYCQRPITRCLQ